MQGNLDHATKENRRWSAGSIVRLLRETLHRRYVRALLSSTAASLILLSVLACSLEIRHEVSYRAVVRYFARHHLEQDDITNLLRNPETTRRLAQLRPTSLVDGSIGLFYARENRLEFFPYEPSDAEVKARLRREDLEIFPRLVVPYRRGDLVSLLDGLQAPEVAHRLALEGVDPMRVPWLRWRARIAQSDQERLYLLRRAGQLISHFEPVGYDSDDMQFQDLLRFYDRTAPEGSYVGTFEIKPPPLGLGIDLEQESQKSQRAHHLVVLLMSDQSLVVLDFFRGRNTARYRIRPVEHPMGRTLFKLEKLTAPLQALSLEPNAGLGSAPISPFRDEVAKL